jgi:hypothetical protein
VTVLFSISSEKVTVILSVQELLRALFAGKKGFVGSKVGASDSVIVRSRTIRFAIDIVTDPLSTQTVELSIVALSIVA